MLRGKKILLGITGSIAAYKSAILCRALIKEGAEVRVVMTASAKDFISPLTFSTLSKNVVLSEISDGTSWNDHVALGIWADIFLIAPCTATTISKMASGLSDNLLLAVYLSAKCPVMIAPAMDLDMWIHPATKLNLQKLASYGNEIIPVGNGFLASGLEGEGRMAEPEQIVKHLEQYFQNKAQLLGKKVLITAGPTYEAIDPVRFIGNRSSGKMGLALAQIFQQCGADVTVVSGPTHINTWPQGVHVLGVQSAEDMYMACLNHIEQADIVIFAAAVADYKPVIVETNKIKKTANNLELALTKTTDIAGSLGKLKRPGQIFVGFALETDQEIEHASEKLHKKNFDFIVLNSLRDEGAGFQHDTNKISIFSKDGKTSHFDLKSKLEVAQDILNFIISNFDIYNEA